MNRISLLVTPIHYHYHSCMESASSVDIRHESTLSCTYSPMYCTTVMNSWYSILYCTVLVQWRTEFLQALHVDPVDKNQAHARALVEPLEDLPQAQLVLVLLHAQVDAVEHRLTLGQSLVQQLLLRLLCTHIEH